MALAGRSEAPTRHRLSGHPAPLSRVLGASAPLSDTSHASHASRARALTAPLLLLLLISPHSLFAWPAAGEWIPITRGGTPVQDPNGDSNGSRNIVGDATHPSGYIANDGTYLYLRLRLDRSPAGQGGQGLLEPYGWGMVIDTNLNAGDYEWLFMVNGIAQTETISLQENTVQGTLGDPSDRSEVLSSSIGLATNYQITAADTSFNNNQDYFLDWRFPYATFKQVTGLSDNSPIRIFGGTSNSANNLTEQGADLMGASDLYAGFSDYISPFGARPTTGTVKFVADLAGNGDVTLINAGNTVYIRVDDGDQNYNPTAANTVTVTISTAAGDHETVTLTETGVNTGIFTGSIPTALGAFTVNNGTLQVLTGELVTVVYVDAIDASLNLNQVRTDLLYVSGPRIVLAKSVDKATVAPGGELIYTIHVRNLGNALAQTIIVIDTVPLNTSYVAGSLRIGDATTTYATATVLTDATDADQGQLSSGNPIFSIPSLQPDDSQANQGLDEKKVYFKVLVP